MQVFLLRHGIAEDAKPGAADSTRALTPEGKRKLKELLRMARAAGVKPALILTSPYRRAVETAQIAASSLGYRKDLLRTKALAPASAPKDVWDEIRVHKDADSLMLVGHEPLLGQILGYLLDAPTLLVDLKKGALCRLDIVEFGAQPRGVLKWLVAPKLAG